MAWRSLSSLKLSTPRQSTRRTVVLPLSSAHDVLETVEPRRDNGIGVRHEIVEPIVGDLRYLDQRKRLLAACCIVHASPAVSEYALVSLGLSGADHQRETELLTIGPCHLDDVIVLFLFEIGQCGVI